MIQRTKLPKPYPDFPLTAHANGQWCKKIRQRLHYFGPVADWQTALQLFLDQRDDLQAGRKPRTVNGGPSLALAMDKFLSSKKLAQKSGDISSRTYKEYEATCDRIAAAIDKNRPLADIDLSDLEKLRAGFAIGKRGQRGPTTIKGDLTRARMLFLYVNECGLTEKPIHYRKALKAPSKRVFRKLANELGPRMFTRTEINAILKAASPQLRAMVLLGINCGFGNTDCGTLPLDQVDLDRGWHTYWRPKTHNARRCPLWPETIMALRDAIAKRPQPRSKDDGGLVFLTPLGYRWTNAESRRDNAIGFEFRKLLKRLTIYRKNVTTFYSLRRTFETVASESGQQVAIDYIMGHVAPNDDMAAIYRQKTYDGPLLKVTKHVRAWLNGRKRIE